MKVSNTKNIKDLEKSLLRDNMTSIEVLLTDLGEIAARDIAKSENPQGFKENKVLTYLNYMSYLTVTHFLLHFYF